MNKPLTNKQQRVYSFIRDFIGQKGYSPTLNEIVTEIGVTAINTVVKYLKVLEYKGYISRLKHTKRGITIRNDCTISPTMQVPVLASVGCDDLSIVANEKYDEFLEVDQKIIGNKKDVIAVRAVGNSMNDAGIEDGDYILVEKTEIAENGERVVAIVSDMVTVKKIEKKNGLTILWPESKDSKYKPIILKEDFKIAGKVICTIPGNSMDPSEMVYEKINN